MSEPGIPVEERLDAMYRIVSFVFLAVGTVHGAGALREVLAPNGLMHAVATQVGRAFIVVVAILCTWAIWRGIMLKIRNGRGHSLAAGGFVLEAIQRAAVTAGLVAYATLVVMHGASDDTMLSVRFFLNGAMALMTLTFGVSYLVRTTVGTDRE